MTLRRMNRRLVHEARLLSPNGAGGLDAAWQVLGTHWASLVPSGGALAETPGATLARQPWKIFLRAAPPGSPARPMAGHRLRDGARLFRILSVAEAPGLRRLVCRCVEEETSA